MSYIDFVERKAHTGADAGIEISETWDMLFDFQKHIVDVCARRGRHAGFVDTGLGKTLCEMNLAQHYAEQTNKPSLIVTPLAVAFQFESESKKWGVCEVEQTKDGRHSGDIVLCNYERIGKLNPDDFGCVILDESSILKNNEGKIKERITSFMRNVDYRYLFTATPAPNDFIELGTSSEALGYMGYMDMLNTFFTNKEKTSDPARIGSPWYLKPHAEDNFFAWVNTWSLSAKNPSCLGFDDSKFILPELKEHDHEIESSIEKKDKLTFADIRRIQKETVQDRCEKAVELSEGEDSTVYWCHRNDESETLSNLAECSEVKGSMSIDKKEEILLAFATGEIKRIVTKPKITGFGLNWQHCRHSTYFPTFSYEQYYQSIRRFWRFGQTDTVNIDRVYSDAEYRVIDSLSEKAKKADALYANLNDKLRNSFVPKADEYDHKIALPGFL